MASTGEVWKLGHRPALDGVRGVAILLVVIGHANPNLAGLGGMVGVTLFFVLSGYLITGILLREREATGRVSLRAFYRRRFLRLAPALLFMLLGAGVLLWMVGSPLANTYPAKAMAAAVYVSNLVVISGGDMGALGHTWSLAMEEQFYLTWPPLLVLLPRRRVSVRWLFAVVAGAAVAAAGWRIVAATELAYLRVLFGPDTNVCAILAGCALAIYQAMTPMREVPRGAAYGGLWVLVLVALLPGAWQFMLFGAPVVALAAVVLLAGCSTAAPRFLESRLFGLLGLLSYGWYLWHQVLLKLAEHSGQPWLEGQAARNLVLLVALGVAWCSWRWIETPFLRLKTRGGGLRVAARAPQTPLPRARVQARHGSETVAAADLP